MNLRLRSVAIAAAVACTWWSCSAGIDNPMLCTGAACDGGATGGGTGGGTTGGGTTGGGTAGGGTTGGGATGGGTTGGGTTGGGTGGGTTGGGTGGGTTGGGTGGGSGCVEDWLCGYWQPGTTAGQATRTCLDQNFCGTTNTKPSEGPLTLPALDQNYFRCNVMPVLAKSCAMIGCHGTRDTQARPFRIFARGRERNDETVMVPGMCLQSGTQTIYLPNVSATGSCYATVPLTATEKRLNFDEARCMGAGGVATAMNELLQQPLEGSSFTHAGIKPWKTTANADYVLVQNWLNGMTLATCTSPN